MLETFPVGRILVSFMGLTLTPSPPPLTPPQPFENCLNRTQPSYISTPPRNVHVHPQHDRMVLEQAENKKWQDLKDWFCSSITLDRLQDKLCGTHLLCCTFVHVCDAVAGEEKGVIFLHNSKKLLASAESNIPKCYEQRYTIYSWIKYTYQQASNLSAEKHFGLILRGDNIITITMIIIFIIIIIQ